MCGILLWPHNTLHLKKEGDKSQHFFYIWVTAAENQLSFLMMTQEICSDMYFIHFTLSTIQIILI